MAGVVVEFAGGRGSWVQRTYSASRGGGAFLGGERIGVSRTAELQRALLVSPPARHCTALGFASRHPFACPLPLIAWSSCQAPRLPPDTPLHVLTACRVTTAGPKHHCLCTFILLGRLRAVRKRRLLCIVSVGECCKARG